MVTLPGLLAPLAIPCMARGPSCHQPPASQGTVRTTVGSMGCSLGCPSSCHPAEGSNRGTQGSMAGDKINLWGARHCPQGVATASNPLLPGEPRRAALGLFMAPLAAGLLGFAGCGPGSLIPPIIYLIQTLCRAAIIASELPHCLTINISSGVPGRGAEGHTASPAQDCREVDPFRL